MTDFLYLYCDTDADTFQGAHPEETFRQLADDGLQRRLAHLPASVDKNAYHQRLHDEMRVILELGFAPHFLAVQEYVTWARGRGIPVGPGYGSAPGSLVVWALHITDIDPIAHGLLFERFLNIERVTLPEIIVPVCPRHRDDVAAYLGDRFGADPEARPGRACFVLESNAALPVISDTLASIRANGAYLPEFGPGLALLPTDDAATFAAYAQKDATGIYMMDIPGMAPYARQFRPSSLADLAALFALCRPGPIESGMMDEFIQRKQGALPAVAPHPRLEACLRETCGCLIYQEQIVQIAHATARFTLGVADILRRMLAKKSPHIPRERDIFVSGAVQNGLARTEAVAIFDLLAKAAPYCCSKSHAMAEALLSYRTAWLKTHYPNEFMAARAAVRDTLRE